MSTEADAILEEAYRILETGEKLWCKDHEYTGPSREESTAVCLVGAFRLATERVAPTLLYGDVEDTIRDRLVAATGVSGKTYISNWNDDPHTTKEDVLLALKRARYDFGDES